MAAAETLFAADSAAAVELLQLASGSGSTIDRTTLALLSVDALLAALGLDAPWPPGVVPAVPSPSGHESGDEYRRRQGLLRSARGRPRRW